MSEQHPSTGQRLTSSDMPLPSRMQCVTFQLNCTVHGPSTFTKWTASLRDPIGQVELHRARGATYNVTEARELLRIGTMDLIGQLYYLTGLGVIPGWID